MAITAFFNPAQVGKLSLAAALAVLMSGAAMAQTAAGSGAAMVPPAATIVAKVGDHDVMFSDISELYARLPAQYRQRSIDALFPQLLERLIDSRLLGQAALDAGVDSRPDVKRRIKSAIDDVVAQVFLTEKVESMLTEEMLQARYQETAAQAAGGGDEVKARHILLDTEAAAKDVIAALAAGADFATLAQEKSTGPSKTQGGDLGWFAAEQMVPEFSQAAFALQPVSVTPTPVKTQFGWHVIKVEDRRANTPPSFEEMRNQISVQLTQEIVRDYLDDLRKDVKVERFNFDGSPAQ